MNAFDIAALTGVVTLAGKLAGNKQLDHASYIKLAAAAFFYLLVISLLDAANGELASAFALLVFLTALLDNAEVIITGLGLN